MANSTVPNGFYTFATLPPANSVTPGIQLVTIDGNVYVSNGITWALDSGPGGGGGTAGTTSLLNYGGKQDGVTDDSGALTAYLTATGSTASTLSVTGPVLLSSAATIPSNVKLSFSGTGLLRPANARTITLNCTISAGAWQVFDNSLGGSFTGAITNKEVYAAWFGAKGDGATASGVLINNALFLAKNSGVPTVLGGGTYKTQDATISLGSQSFTRPLLIGASKKQTILDFSGAGASFIGVKIIGGSGQVTGDAILNLNLVGNSTSILLEFNGSCGAKATNVLFGTGAVGVRWHNELASSFTEFCTLDGCEFSNTCTLPMEYKRTSGTNSFHGSGPGGGDTNIVQNAATVVQIDGTGCFVYSAPCNLQVFAVTTNCIIFQNNNSVAPTQVTFAGTLDIETNISQTVALGAGSNTYFCGPIRLIGAITNSATNISPGSLARVESVQYHQDGSASYTGGRLNQILAMTTGANTVGTFMASGHRLVYLYFVAANYDYRYLLSVDRDFTGGSGFVATLATLRSFNTAGYGAPTFTADTSGRLVITNATFPASGVTCHVAEMQLFNGVGGAGRFNF